MEVNPPLTLPPLSPGGRGAGGEGESCVTWHPPSHAVTTEVVTTNGSISPNPHPTPFMAKTRNRSSIAPTCTRVPIANKDSPLLRA